MNNSWLYETTLNGKLVTLAPLNREHTDALLAAASDGNYGTSGTHLFQAAKH